MSAFMRAISVSSLNLSHAIIFPYWDVRKKATVVGGYPDSLMVWRKSGYSLKSIPGGEVF